MPGHVRHVPLAAVGAGAAQSRHPATIDAHADATALHDPAAGVPSGSGVRRQHVVVGLWRRHVHVRVVGAE